MKVLFYRLSSFLASAATLLTVFAWYACTRVDDSASLKTLYGPDNRLDVLDSTSAELKEAGRSVALITDQSELTPLDASTFTLGKKTLKERYQVCDAEPFSAQTSAGYCTAFLVADDIVATAGHCLDQANACETMRLVFDYAQPSSSAQPISISHTSVYSCREVITKTYQNSPGFDFALLRLDRAVTDRRPLPYRKSGEPGLGQALLLMGHPLGLPLKLAADAKVMPAMLGHPVRFDADLDGYEINSGSPVLNADSDEVEGIFVGGWTDLIRSPAGCKRSYSCEGDCTGAQVVRMGPMVPHLAEAHPAVHESGSHVLSFTKEGLPLAIPNYNPAGVSQTFEVTETGLLADVAVQLKITHPSIDELNLTLTPPGGTPLPLHLPGVLRGRDRDLSFGGKGTPVIGLSALRGIPISGLWTLTLVDNVRGGGMATEGLLEEFKLILTRSP